VSRRDLRFYLEDLLEAIEKIERYTAGLTREEFLANELVADAVIRNLEVVGEVARHIPDELRAKFPEVNWRGIVGFRNVLIHEYFAVDLDVVWTIVANHLPELKQVFQKMLRERP